MAERKKYKIYGKIDSDRPSHADHPDTMGLIGICGAMGARTRGQSLRGSKRRLAAASFYGYNLEAS